MSLVSSALEECQTQQWATCTSPFLPRPSYQDQHSRSVW